MWGHFGAPSFLSETPLSCGRASPAMCGQDSSKPDHSPVLEARAQGAVPIFVIAPRGTETSTMVCRAPRGENMALGAVHRAVKSETGDESGRRVVARDTMFW